MKRRKVLGCEGGIEKETFEELSKQYCAIPWLKALKESHSLTVDVLTSFFSLTPRLAYFRVRFCLNKF
jgi:hypothetical protein